jgi:hypothetical protein
MFLGQHLARKSGFMVKSILHENKQYLRHIREEHGSSLDRKHGFLSMMFHGA